MFRRFRVFIINQLGFSKKEANGVILLFVFIILITMGIRLPVWYGEPAETNDKDELRAWVDEIENSIQKAESEKTVVDPFNFDPNLASSDELERLGFEPSISQRIVNYRNAGGRFHKDSDLEKIYGINSDLLVSLEPFIQITPIEKPLEKTNTLPDEKQSYAEPAALTTAKLDLNTSSAEDLRKIRGIGPVLSERTIEYRQKLGGYLNFDQLTEVYGLSDTLLTQFDRLFFIDSTQLTTISINTDSIRHLSEHPYIDYNLARAIVNYRQSNGDYDRLEDLLEIKIMTDSLYQKLYFYLSIRH